mgnify:CR=1 FL=1|jgi:hypothetical protein
MQRFLVAIAIALVPFGSGSICQTEESAVGRWHGSKSGVFLPIDEASANPGFVAFRDSLRSAVRQRDLGFILRHLDENIHASLGGRYGPTDFVEFWNLNECPGGSRFWHEMEDVVRLGGTFEDAEMTSFTMPYIFSRFPFGLYPDEEDFRLGAITDSLVLLRGVDSETGEVVDTLAFDVVKVVWELSRIKPIERCDPEFPEWQRIRTLTGSEGYVRRQSVRFTSQYRANFALKDGVWKMTFFLAGI